MLMVVGGICNVVRVVKMTVVVVMAIDIELIEIGLEVVVSNFNVEGIAVVDLVVEMVSVVVTITALFVIESIVGIAVVVWMPGDTLGIVEVRVGYWVV